MTFFYYYANSGQFNVFLVYTFSNESMYLILYPLFADRRLTPSFLPVEFKMSLLGEGGQVLVIEPHTGPG